MPDAPPRYTPIEDYAVIGDCASAALVGRDGSIDWLCWPRFDSPSIFASLLDADVGGHFQIQPIGDFEVDRRYVNDTNVLETTFTTEDGVLRVTDLMPVARRKAYERELWPTRELLRRVECVEGTVDVDVVCDPRIEYGQVDPPLDDRGPHGFFYNYEGAVLIVRSELPLTLSHAHGTLHGQWTLQEGDRQFLSLTYDEGTPAVLPMSQTDRVSVQTYVPADQRGRWREEVYRSALALKLLTYEPTGAIVAAPTTSLPEAIGGERNWDYRYCWLRDAALTLRVLYELGYEEEGQAFFSWLLHATRLTAPKLHVLYDVYGNVNVEERTLSHLEGYRQSLPVRVGNGAHDQLQLDTYGELISAAYEFVQREHSLGDWHARLLADLGEEVCARWQEADEGIWEVRTGRHHHTFSKVMCWVALERLVALHEEGYVEVPVGKYRDEAAQIRVAVEEHGYNEAQDSYVATFDGDRLDASLLLLPTYGYKEATAPRMKSTFARIHEELSYNGLLHRYPADTDDGFASEEGAFGICSFWDEELFARLGRVDEAREKLSETISYANDLGLFAEEIDVETGAFLGNFPQAFTHVGLINAAITIEKVSEDASTLYKQPDSAP
ncbi:MAG: glycoside hydrolase family 15 protein [Bacteroidetes bacterium QS_1_63_11]|nr:MAG: glycoside hydrolase family 15 protein [Bacteroidetes bacterium QS_1_63_11]